MADKKPNIIVILADDHGSWALGCAGNDEIYTPNIDWLAQNGTRLENFFCTSPVCSPARASLMTGKIPSQHGVMDWIREGNIGDDSIEYLRGHKGYTDFLADEGYTCCLSGKWHLGDSAKPQKSFSRWFVHQKGGSPYHGAPMVSEGKLINVNGYLTDVITEKSIEFIKENMVADQPFYLSVHYTAPHAPWINQHPEKWVNYYQDCEFLSCPQQKETHPWRLASTEPTVTPENVKDHLIGYYAAVSAMDENIGLILSFLKENNLMDNTLIVFMGDNGMNCGHHGIWGKGNGTFPANMYDTSVKVPAIFYYKNKVIKGKTSEALLSGYDFMPTLLDLLHIANPQSENLPGESFVPVLTSEEKITDRPIVVMGEYGPTRMIRTKNLEIYS